LFPGVKNWVLMNKTGRGARRQQVLGEFGRQEDRSWHAIRAIALAAAPSLPRSAIDPGVAATVWMNSREVAVAIHIDSDDIEPAHHRGTEREARRR
jgi:hypothetical protein